jgi:dipeptidyl aminopeptidase/acylaminoacyl peptidase
MYSPPRVCTIDADGRNLKRLDKLNGVSPVWSPDGKRLLFTRLGKDLETGLYVADADGANVRSLLKRNDYEMITGAWSPDGKLLAYAVPSDDPDRRKNGGRSEAGLFLARADGSRPKRLAGGPSKSPMASSGLQTASACTSPVAIARDRWSTRRIRLKAATGVPARFTQ